MKVRRFVSAACHLVPHQHFYIPSFLDLWSKLKWTDKETDRQRDRRRDRLKDTQTEEQTNSSTPSQPDSMAETDRSYLAAAAAPG